MAMIQGDAHLAEVQKKAELVRERLQSEGSTAPLGIALIATGIAMLAGLGMADYSIRDLFELFLRTYAGRRATIERPSGQEMASLLAEHEAQKRS